MIKKRANFRQLSKILTLQVLMLDKTRDIFCYFAASHVSVCLKSTLAKMFVLQIYWLLASAVLTEVPQNVLSHEAL